jgi:hypothetical protein
VLDLSHVFDGQKPGALMLNDPLKHSNALANTAIADALYQQLMTKPAIALSRRAARLGVRADSKPAYGSFTKWRWPWKAQ